DGTLEEPLVLPDGHRDGREEVNQALRELAVRGEVVPTAEEVVVDPRDRRRARIEVGHARNVTCLSPHRAWSSPGPRAMPLIGFLLVPGRAASACRLTSPRYRRRDGGSARRRR